MSGLPMIFSSSRVKSSLSISRSISSRASPLPDLKQRIYFVSPPVRASSRMRTVGRTLIYPCRMANSSFKGSGCSGQPFTIHFRSISIVVSPISFLLILAQFFRIMKRSIE